MNDLGNLQLRVGKAVDRLRESEQQRRHGNESLGRVLNDLEIKFEARKTELDHCRSRIVQLEESNRALTGLVGELVEIIERTADQAAEDPVYRTTAAAGDIVSRYVPATTANEPANDKGETVAGNDRSETVAENDRSETVAENDKGETVAENDKGETVAEKVSVEAPRFASSLESCGWAFEDIEADYLLAEELFEKSSGGSGFPRLVHDAVAMARGETPAAEVSGDDGIDIPEPVRPRGARTAEAGGRTENLDIKEIMARLEIAAERAQSRAEAESGAARKGKAGAGEAQALRA